MRYLISTLCALLLLTGTANAAQTTCNLSPHFTLLKDYDANNSAVGHSWNVLYKGRSVRQFNAAELHDIFGGNAVPPDCSGIIVNANSFALVVGWKSDLLIAFGIESGSEGFKGINVLRYYPHDGAMSVQGDGNNIFVTWGSNGNYR